MTAEERQHVIKSISFLVSIFFITIPSYGKYSGGTGEPNDPYQIATAEDLIALGEEPNDYDKHFILITDINLSGYSFDRSLIAPDTTLVDISFSGNSFTGIFDGNNHKISNLTITGEGYLGLFGVLESGAEVKNLSVVDVNITSSGKRIGGLVGVINEGFVTSIYVSGNISGDDYVGGLVGYINHGTVSKCSSIGFVTGSFQVGGLVGHNHFGSILNSYSECYVKGERTIGGLVGDNMPWADIMNCYATGDVMGNDFVGGLVGDNTCRGSVGTVSNCYSVGRVTGRLYTGGIVGWNCGVVLSSFWNTNTSGLLTSDGGIPKTTAEMQNENTFIDAGWDFVGEVANGSDDIWKISDGLDYPRLWWEKYGGGTGTCTDPYRIYTAQHLNTLGVEPNDWDKHFKLMADLDLSGYLYDRALIAYDTNNVKDYFQGIEFTGVFDGAGHTISHLTIIGVDFLGLFGRLGKYSSESEVRNLGMVDVSVTGSGDYFGGLVGWNRCGVINCYSTGIVNGDYCVGGLVGHNYGTVSSCYSAGTIVGKRCIGGLVGDNYSNSIVFQSYSTGIVSGNHDIGGLVGENLGIIFQCYSTGTVNGSELVGGLVGNDYLRGGRGRAYSCFWDIEASGLNTSAGGTGKTTAQMQDPNLFISEGWDFVGESNNGVHETWQIPEEGGYPVLAVLNGYLPPQLEGNGTYKNPYLIHDAMELGAIIQYNPYAHYQLAASIDLSDISWCMGVIPWFYGRFDGDGYTISNLTIKGREYVGLFGLLGAEAAVVNLGVVDVNITGYENLVGGLVGYNYGAVTQCYSTGMVDGNDDCVGGLIGYNSYGLGYNGYNSYGTVTKCYSTCMVSGDDNIGGLVGCNDGGELTFCYSSGSVSGAEAIGGLVGQSIWSQGASWPGPKHRDLITNCYATSSVSGKRDVGGLFGTNYVQVINCFSTGSVSGEENVGGLVGSGSMGDTVRESFWDVQSSSQLSSAGGIGLITIQMKTKSTFTDVGWDFIGETINGTEDFWWIDEGLDYPRLWWEHFAGDKLIIVVDDFEDYNDFPGYEIWNTWIDPYNNLVNGGIVGHSIPPYTEQIIVHGGSQSMPFFYANIDDVFNSRAYRSFYPGQDWTINGADTLLLWLRGSFGSGIDAFYITVQDGTGKSQTVFNPDPNAVMEEIWTPWFIPLSDLTAAGVNLQNIISLEIGVGDKNKPSRNVSGIMYIDDICIIIKGISN